MFVMSVCAEQITLNLNNADITALIKTVSEHTGKNFVIDPRVTGKVTVIYDAPCSGSFLPYLIPPAERDRILIAGSEADQSNGDVARA